MWQTPNVFLMNLLSPIPNWLALTCLTTALLLATNGISKANAADASPIVIDAATPDDSVVIAVGSEGRRLLTDDGNEWKDQPKSGRYFQPGPPPDRFEGYNGHNNSLYAIIGGSDGFLAAGNYGNVIIQSESGRDWEDLYTADELALCRDLESGNGRTLVVGWKNDRGNALGILDETQSWDFVELPEELSDDAPLRSLAFGEELFVLVTDDGAIGATRDGQEWLQRFPALGTTDDRFRVHYGGGKFLILGGSTSLISEDGLSWEAVELPGQLPAGTVPATWTGEGFVVVNFVAREVYWSEDGIQWETFEAKGDLPKLQALLAADDRLFGLDYGLRIVTSHNGLEWKTIFNGSEVSDYSNQFYDLAAGPAAQPAAGQEPRISKK